MAEVAPWRGWLCVSLQAAPLLAGFQGSGWSLVEVAPRSAPFLRVPEAPNLHQQRWLALRGTLAASPGRLLVLSLRKEGVCVFKRRLQQAELRPPAAG